MAEKKWIKGAIKHPGALKNAAKREGVSTKEYVDEHDHDSGKAGRRARLAKTLMAMHNKGKDKAKDERPTSKGFAKKMYGSKD